MTNVSSEYTGMVLYTSQAVKTSHISIRIYVNKPSVFTLGVNYVGMPSGFHAFIPILNTTTILRQFTPGWQLVEGDVPPVFDGQPTGALIGIIFEMQANATLANFSIDDLRLTP
jgi:hypothetical protein